MIFFNFRTGLENINCMYNCIFLFSSNQSVAKSKRKRFSFMIGKVKWLSWNLSLAHGAEIKGISPHKLSNPRFKPASVTGPKLSQWLPYILIQNVKKIKWVYWPCQGLFDGHHQVYWHFYQWRQRHTQILSMLQVWVPSQTQVVP